MFVHTPGLGWLFGYLARVSRPKVPWASSGEKHGHLPLDTACFMSGSHLDFARDRLLLLPVDLIYTRTTSVLRSKSY